MSIGLTFWQQITFFILVFALISDILLIARQANIQMLYCQINNEK